jgi:hypothetical protein
LKRFFLCGPFRGYITSSSFDFGNAEEGEEQPLKAVTRRLVTTATEATRERKRVRERE